MGRGLDGFLIPVVTLCGFEGPPGGFSRQFPVAMARGKHLFPFRTEQLSPSAPMVLGLKGPGRVGRRRFLHHEAALWAASSSLWAEVRWAAVREHRAVPARAGHARGGPRVPAGAG